ncbi:hypothetical protein GGF31_007327 [Allomyces arbusculus]|nr:hypothetical protein GGF31_007327 [Allomyces arbusculus]
MTASAAHEPTQYSYLDSEDDDFFLHDFHDDVYDDYDDDPDRLFYGDFTSDDWEYDDVPDDGPDSLYDDDFTSNGVDYDDFDMHDFYDDVYDHYDDDPDRLFYGDFTSDDWEYDDVPDDGPVSLYDDDFTSNGVAYDDFDSLFFHDDAPGCWHYDDVPDSDHFDDALDNVYSDVKEDVPNDGHLENYSRHGNGMDLFDLIEVTPEICSAIQANTNMATLPTRIPRWVPKFIAAVCEQTRSRWVRHDLYHAVFHNGHWWVAAGWFAYLLFPQLWGPGRDNYTTARVHIQRTLRDMQPTKDVARKDLANNGEPGTWFVRVDKFETLLLPALIRWWGRECGAIIYSPFAALVLQKKSTLDFLLSLLQC